MIKIKLAMKQFKLNDRGIAALILIALIALTSIAVAAGISYSQNRQANSSLNQTNLNNPTSNSSNQTISLLSLNSGQISDQNLSQSPDLKSKQVLADGTTKYSLNSSFANRDNIVLIKDNQVIFSRVALYTSGQALPKLSEYLTKYGTPENILTGSRYFGPYQKFYVYPSKGISLTANPTTDEVYELQTFLPTDLDGFLKNWSQDYYSSDGSIIEP